MIVMRALNFALGSQWVTTCRHYLLLEPALPLLGFIIPIVPHALVVARPRYQHHLQHEGTFILEADGIVFNIFVVLDAPECRPLLGVDQIPLDHPQSEPILPSHDDLVLVVFLLDHLELEPLHHSVLAQVETHLPVISEILCELFLEVHGLPVEFLRPVAYRGDLPLLGLLSEHPFLLDGGSAAAEHTAQDHHEQQYRGDDYNDSPLSCMVGDLALTLGRAAGQYLLLQIGDILAVVFAPALAHTDVCITGPLPKSQQLPSDRHEQQHSKLFWLHV